MKIKFIVPQKNEKWILTFGTGKLTKNKVELLYGMLERRLGRYLASSHADKTYVHVIYGTDSTNTSEKSKDINYLLWITAQFLEDYVTRDWLLRKEKQYGRINS